MVTYYVLACILQMMQWPYLLSISLRGLVQHSVRKSMYNEDAGVGDGVTREHSRSFATQELGASSTPKVGCGIAIFKSHIQGPSLGNHRIDTSLYSSKYNVSQKLCVWQYWDFCQTTYTQFSNYLYTIFSVPWLKD